MRCNRSALVDGIPFKNANALSFPGGEFFSISWNPYKSRPVIHFNDSDSGLALFSYCLLEFMYDVEDIFIPETKEDFDLLDFARNFLDHYAASSKSEFSSDGFGFNFDTCTFGDCNFYGFEGADCDA